MRNKMVRRSMVSIKQSIKALTFLFLISGLLSGCMTLPDTSGYTIATIQVKQAVATAGNVVEAELKSAGSVSGKSISGFRDAWKKTVDSLDAKIAYAESIEKIVDAGNKGAASAKKVAASVRKLAETVKVDAMTGAAGEVFGVAADTGAFVYGEIAKISAAKNLDAAISKAGPWVVRINTMAQLQVEDARRLFHSQIRDQIQDIEKGGDEGYGDWIKVNKTTRSNQLEVIKEIIEEMSKPFDNPTRDVVKVQRLQAELDQIEKTRSQIEPHIAEYKAKLAVIRNRKKAGLNVLRASENAIAAWGTAHQNLVQAIKNRKPVSVKSLTMAVTEIRTLIERWREL